MNNFTDLGGDPAIVLFFVVLISLPVTVIVSLWLVGRYRSAVDQSMKRPARQSTSASLASVITQRTASKSTPQAHLQIRQIDVKSSIELNEKANLVWQRSQRCLWKIGLAYGSAGFSQAALLLIIYFFSAEIDFRPFRTLVILLIFAWPIIPALITIGIGGSRARWLLPLAYLLLGFALYPPYFSQFIILGAMFMGPPTLMFLMISNRWLRAVAPMVAVVICVFLFTLLATPDIMLWLLPNRFLANLSPFVALAGAGFLAWWVVRWFASRYQKKQASDQILQLEAWWILVTLFESLSISTFGGTGGFLLGLATFAVFKWVLAWRLRPLAAEVGQQPDLSLLLLRVFGFQGRSESLLESIGVQWRYLGSIQMIAGTDLASATLEPHEFFAYINGRLSRQFVKDAPDLDQRIGLVDRVPDPDGRFRVNEFFCHDDTWRMTLQRLVKESHVVLMDLRTFGPKNAGCLYELSQLVDLVPIEQTIFLIDSTTEEAYLREQLQFLWQTMDNSSPNWSAQAPTTTLLRIENQNDRSVDLLMRLLLFNAQAPASAPIIETAKESIE